MKSIFSRLRNRSDFHTVEPISEGFLIHPVEGHEDDFSQLIRDALNATSDDFVILPISTHGRYERAHVIPLLD